MSAVFLAALFQWLTMNRIQKLIIIFSALLLGVISYYLFTGWLNVIPWTIFALLTGWLSAGRRNVIINGALFGYFLFLAYIIIGYKGDLDKTSILKFVFFTIAFSLVGAIAGMIGGLIGNFLRNKWTSRADKN